MVKCREWWSVEVEVPPGGSKSLICCIWVDRSMQMQMSPLFYQADQSCIVMCMSRINYCWFNYTLLSKAYHRNPLIIEHHSASCLIDAEQLFLCAKEVRR